MESDRPVGSVTDRNGWRWNRLQAESAPRKTGSRTTAGPRVGLEEVPDGHRCPRTPPCGPCQRTIRTLEYALERDEDRRRHLRQRYEELLARRTERLQECEGASGAGRWATILGAVLGSVGRN